MFGNSAYWKAQCKYVARRLTEQEERLASVILRHAEDVNALREKLSGKSDALLIALDGRDTMKKERDNTQVSLRHYQAQNARFQLANARHTKEAASQAKEIKELKDRLHTGNESLKRQLRNQSNVIASQIDETSVTGATIGFLSDKIDGLEASKKELSLQLSDSQRYTDNESLKGRLEIAVRGKLAASSELTALKARIRRHNDVVLGSK